ncbi:MAG TPA: hypothetical protein VK941_13230 [Gillisia sp.]|nr:hypothetical protein [Gillisia sp.]
MKRYQIHIGHFLLAGFLFPQVANAVHYLVQSHTLSSQLSETYDIATPPYDYHNCEYQFNSLKYYVTTDVELKPTILSPREREEKYFYGIKFVNELAFHYSLRGPPAIIDYFEEQSLFI